MVITHRPNVFSIDGNTALPRAAYRLPLQEIVRIARGATKTPVSDLHAPAGKQIARSAKR